MRPIALDYAAVRAAPPVRGQGLFELDLTLGQRGGGLEPFDPFGAVGLGDDQLEDAIAGLAGLAPHVRASSFKQPNHRSGSLPENGLSGGRITCSRQPMDLRQLEILQTIAETGSFTACGRRLNVSQSAISRQILLLEEELGEPLFLRTGRRVRMTPAAESLVQLGKRVFQDLRETVGSITDQTRELRGTVKLSGGMTVCLYIFPLLLKQLRRAHPQLDLRLTVASAGRSVEEIRAGHIDAGLLTLPVEESDLVTLPVMREELLLVATPQHALARRRRVAPQDLIGQPFVLFEPGSATRHVLDHFFVSQKIEPKVVMETENVEILKAMVKTGLGVSILPYLAVAREVRAGQFFCARMEGQELIRETGWVYARANRVPRVIQEVLKAFEEIRGRLRLSPPRPHSTAHKPRGGDSGSPPARA